MTPVPIRRLTLAAAALVLLGIVLAAMVRLPWQLDTLIAFAAVLAFAFYFERNDAHPGNG
jgi:hypothetical protein